MATIALHLFEDDSCIEGNLLEPTLSRVPIVGEHVRIANKNKDWFLVKLVVHIEIPADKIEADVYAVKVDHHQVMREQGFLE